MADVDTKDSIVRLRVSTDEKLRWVGHARHLKLSEFVRLAVARYCEDLEGPEVQAKVLERQVVLDSSFPGSSTEARPVYPNNKEYRKAPRKSQERLCEHRVPRDTYCPRCDA